MAGGLGGGHSPTSCCRCGKCDDSYITGESHRAIAAAKQQEEGEGGVDREEEEEDDDLPYPQDDNDDDDNDSEGKVCVPIGITPKHFNV